MPSSLKRAPLGLLEIAYGLFAVVAFLVCGLLAVALVLLPLGVTARRHMAHFKCPRTVVFGPLPKTSTGKIQKFVLRDRAAAL